MDIAVVVQSLGTLAAELAKDKLVCDVEVRGFEPGVLAQLATELGEKVHSDVLTSDGSTRRYDRISVRLGPKVFLMAEAVMQEIK